MSVFSSSFFLLLAIFSLSNESPSRSKRSPPQPLTQDVASLVSDIISNLGQEPPEGEFLSQKDIDQLKSISFTKLRRSSSNASVANLSQAALNQAKYGLSQYSDSEQSNYNGYSQNHKQYDPNYNMRYQPNSQYQFDSPQSRQVSSQSTQTDDFNSPATRETPPPPRETAPPPPPLPPTYYDPYPKEPWKEDHKKKNTGLQVGLGVGIGIPVGIILFGCFAFVFFRCRKSRRDRRRLFPLPVPKVVNSYVKQNDSPAIASSDPWELNRLSLSVNYDKKLGSGAFCNVFEGHIIGDAPVSRVFPGVRTSSLRDCPVAVKMLPSFADDIARSDFMQEINFMKSLAYHPHLVSMLGFVSDKKTPFLLVEYCEKGDLLHYIRQKKNEIEQGLMLPDGMKIKDLLSFSWQISNGLEYLNSVGCIHRDVAARNVLVDSQNQCKIGDFGLCRLTDSLLYTARGGRLPLKWMAPESLEKYEYSFKSDVWSYAVVLWELFSLGQVPFNLIQTTELLEYLKEGKRLEQPVLCTDEIFDIMCECWEFEARKRPTFNKICVRLAAMLERATESYGYLVPTKRTNTPIPLTIQTDNV